MELKKHNKRTLVYLGKEKHFSTVAYALTVKCDSQNQETTNFMANE